jgi:hypothetical protein
MYDLKFVLLVLLPLKCWRHSIARVVLKTGMREFFLQKTGDNLLLWVEYEIWIHTVWLGKRQVLGVRWPPLRFSPLLPLTALTRVTFPASWSAQCLLSTYRTIPRDCVPYPTRLYYIPRDCTISHETVLYPSELYHILPNSPFSSALHCSVSVTRWTCDFNWQYTLGAAQFGQGSRGNDSFKSQYFE